MCQGMAGVNDVPATFHKKKLNINYFLSLFNNRFPSFNFTVKTSDEQALQVINVPMR